LYERINGYLLVLPGQYSRRYKKHMVGENNVSHLHVLHKRIALGVKIANYPFFFVSSVLNKEVQQKYYKTTA